MLTNHEANARKFLSDLEEESNLKFGWNCYLFKKLLQFNLINPATDNHAEFIKNYKKSFINTDYRDYLIKDSRSFEMKKYLNKLFENNTEINLIQQNINRLALQKKINDFAQNLSLAENEKHIGSIFALYYSLGIQDSKNDYETKVAEENIHNRWTKCHKINAEDKSEGLVDWPVNKIHYRLGGEKIPTSFYAAMGFNDAPLNIPESNLSFNLKPIGFFDTLFNTKDGKEFSEIIALGFTQNDGVENSDFDNYFQPRQGYNEVAFEREDLLQDDNHSYTLQSQPVNSIGCSSYKLTCTQNNFATNIRTTMHFNVSQIQTNDGTEILFTKEFLADFVKKLDKAREKGKKILVHCKAGIGRTGNIIGLMIASQNDVFEYIFSDDDFEKILKRLTVFIESLRESRPGFVAEPSQLYAVVECALLYRQQLKATQEKKAAASNSSATFGVHGFYSNSGEKIKLLETSVTPSGPGQF